MKHVTSSVNYRFRDQHGAASTSELRALGVTAAFQRGRVKAGDWDVPAPGVVRVVGSPRTPEQALMIAVLACGMTAAASHQSAAWMWGLLPPPERHAVTVHRNMSKRPRGMTIHRLSDPPAISLRNGIPCTNPLRTLVDLAATSDGPTLDDAVDRALARKLVTIEGLEAEIGRLARPGRRGVGVLRTALSRRGMVSGPAPSVLESRVLRLLRRGGIEPAGREVVAGPDGRYRIDVTLEETVAMEVDGQAYHGSPEQRAHDERRRNEIRLSGIFLLVYDWVAVTRDGRRVLAECRQAVALAAAGRRAAS